MTTPDAPVDRTRDVLRRLVNRFQDLHNDRDPHPWTAWNECDDCILVSEALHFSEPTNGPETDPDYCLAESGHAFPYRCTEPKGHRGPHGCEFAAWPNRTPEPTPEPPVDVASAPNWERCSSCGTRLYSHEKGVCGLCAKGQTPVPPPGTDTHVCGAQLEVVRLRAALERIASAPDMFSVTDWQPVVVGMAEHAQKALGDPGPDTSPAVCQSISPTRSLVCELHEGHDGKHRVGSYVWAADYSAPGHDVPTDAVEDVIHDALFYLDKNRGELVLRWSDDRNIVTPREAESASREVRLALEHKGYRLTSPEEGNRADTSEDANRGPGPDRPHEVPGRPVGEVRADLRGAIQDPGAGRRGPGEVLDPARTTPGRPGEEGRRGVSLGRCDWCPDDVWDNTDHYLGEGYVFHRACARSLVHALRNFDPEGFRPEDDEEFAKLVMLGERSTGSASDAPLKAQVLDLIDAIADLGIDTVGQQYPPSGRYVDEAVRVGVLAARLRAVVSTEGDERG